jgi:hypothetical protein
MTILDSVATLARFPGFYSKHKRILDGSVRGLERQLEDYLASPEVKGDEWGISEYSPDPFSQLYDGTWYQDRERAGDQAYITGVISFIQEGGLKLRHIANPHVLIQAALKPLGDFLFRELWKIPEDASSITDRRIPEIQEALRQGRTAYCYDLSSATDRFPLALQLRVLELLGVSQEWVSFFANCARGSWYLPTRLPFDTTFRGGHLSKTIRWSQGQPLGLYPSFALFSMTHHYLLQGLSRGYGRDRPYRILGDDVVIFDDQVAGDYEKLMVSLGVPISEHKSLTSRHLAEFAGAIILEDQQLWSFKWRGVASDNNFVDLARNLGPRSVKYLLRDRQRRVIDLIRDIPEPWGCGWNPEGKSLSERMGPTWEKLFFTQDTQPLRLRPRSRRIWYAWYGSRKYRKFTGFEPDDASDQDASDLVSDVLGNTFYHLGIELLPNLNFLRRFGDYEGDLLLARDWREISDVLARHTSIEEMVANVSSLRNYERKLGL